MQKLGEIFVTQEWVRNWDQVPAMIELVKDGGFFTKDVLEEYSKKNNLQDISLVQLSKFEDGTIFLHDGHHRSSAIWCAGRDYLREDEYEVTEWKYSDYEDIVFLRNDGSWMGWVTPFDVKNEIRNPDFRQFKDQVNYLYWNQSPMHAEHFIKTNKEKYSKKRELVYLPELSDKFGCPI